MKDIIVVILITTSTVNCFLSVPWAQPLPQIYPQPEDNKFQGCLFISFSMFFYANLNFFLESELKKALIATVTSRIKPRDCIYRITKQGMFQISTKNMTEILRVTKIALEINICLTLAWIFPFTPLSIFIKSSRFLNKIRSLLQVYYSNFSFQLSNSEIDWENWILILFE